MTLNELFEVTGTTLISIEIFDDINRVWEKDAGEQKDCPFMNRNVALVVPHEKKLVIDLWPEMEE